MNVIREDYALPTPYCDVVLLVSDLTKAMKYRNLEKLEKAIAFARREGFHETPYRHLFRAKRMMARLKHIEMLRQEVMKMGLVSFHKISGLFH